LDEYDVSVHIASDHASAVLGAEEALFGNVEEVNGVEVDGRLGEVFKKRERRTGFIGEGLPAENQDVNGIPDDEPVPEDSPLYMGFHSTHGVKPSHPDYKGKEGDVTVHNQATEEKVTIKEGPFEGGTTQHVSLIKLNLHRWYDDHTLEERMKKMFEGLGDPEDIGEVGQKATEGGRFQNNVEEHAEEYGVVGHAEKAARAREDHSPLLLRRDFDTTNGGEAGVHFVSLQRTVSDFVKTRSMIDGRSLSEGYEDIGDKENNGILEFINVKRRGNFVVPPRGLRSLPEV